jgi:penicillin-insensitive murein endopeptidase
VKIGQNIFCILSILACLTASFAPSSVKAESAIPAKKLFGGQILPADLKPKVHGFYSRGCISGAKAVPFDGPTWQTMRLSRNRRWGHPDLVRILEDLSIKASKKGWNGLLIGDMSQPRGGPMLTGHRSHQIGLDADIWFMPMPDKRMTYLERENTSAISVLKNSTYYVDDKRWTQSHTNILYLAAKYREVERILVHPGVKKKLCDTVKGDRSWLHKIRPFWGHHYHFHLRIGCPEGSPGCKSQNATPKSSGCDKNLAWWFKSGLVPKKKAKKTSKKPRHMMLSDLPKTCKVVLNAPSPSLVNATHKIKAVNFTAPDLDVPVFSAGAVIRSKPIESGKSAINSLIAESETSRIPVPMKRPVD